MHQSPFAAWESFYVIVGSSAAALTGLQFVVMALAADTRSRSTTSETVDAFGTPNVAHFSAVLLVSAIMSAPWRSLVNVGLAIGACGVAGVIYGVIVARRARRQTGYKPVLEDWIWHTTLPPVAYAALAGAAVALTRDADDAAYAVAVASLLLLFVGIHNAWDTVAYLITSQKSENTEV